jgi:hypothetical protein
MNSAERRLLRENWHTAAVETMSTCDVVFLDPDNGLEGLSSRRHGARGPKYVFFDDLNDYYDRGQSLVIYHHLDRSGDALAQAKYRVSQLQERLRVSRPIAVKFNRISPRFYFIIPAEPQEALLHDCIERFIDSPWGSHFSRMY